MANTKARCSGCRQYKIRSELTKVGLSGVCSDECRKLLIERHKTKVLRQQANRERKNYRPRVPSGVRKSVRNRDQGCKYCGAASGRLELHHITYRSQGGPDKTWNLIVLCDAHHRLVHTKKRYWQPVLRAYIWLAYVEGLKVLTIPQVEKLLKKRGLLPESTPDPDDGRIIA